MRTLRRHLQRAIWAILVQCLAVAATGCNFSTFKKTTGVTVLQIVELSVDARLVSTTGICTFQVKAATPDLQAQLAYAWTASSGSIVARTDTPENANWNVPEAAGEFLVWVDVSSNNAQDSSANELATAKVQVIVAEDGSISVFKDPEDAVWTLTLQGTTEDTTGTGTPESNSSVYGTPPALAPNATRATLNLLRAYYQ